MTEEALPAPSRRTATKGARIKGRVAPVASAGIVVLGLLLIWSQGHFEGLTDAEVFKERIRSWGPWGPLLFILAMWMIQPFGVPGLVFMVPASLVWSAPAAIALSWVGNMGSSFLAFEFTRRVGHEWVRDRIPPKLQRFDARLAAGGVWPVLALRVVTGQIPPADWLLGVSSVKRGAFLIGTGLGIIPGIVLIVVYGADVLEWLQGHPLLAAALIVLMVVRRVVARKAARDDDGFQSSDER